MKCLSYDAVVIGTGAAGYHAAIRLRQLGVQVAIVTEGTQMGTSRNTGSDKQTYYKLGLGGEAADSVRAMADDLFAGGCVDGDNALCEAALSTRCFLNLCELGVAFPTNRYGEYVGYKTDHDPCARATSAGPLTSKYMTEALEKQARGIDIFDGCRAVKILKHEGRVCGLLCVQGGEKVVFRCGSLVMATGGPAGIYADTVYPKCHTGSSGLAIEAGAKLQNLAFWQYGLASVDPRWNVSGTYMQVLPRFVSVDADGTEHDFLWEHFGDIHEGLSFVFLKGYQWPFDPTKAEKGSSQIDMLVYRERVERKRRVYLDFTRNAGEFDFARLSPEAYAYLDKAGATFGTPIQRLEKMNAPAIRLYRDKGVDLYTQRLEIALCAQHCNGGVAVDLWWQSSVRGLFAVGECAGTHGIARPGGSALNAGQVGGLRAAQYIARYPNPLVEEGIVLEKAQGVTLGEEAVGDAPRRMSDVAAAVRDPEKLRTLLDSVLETLPTTKCGRLRDVLLTQGAVLTAMASPMNDPARVQEVVYEDGVFRLSDRPVRPIPEDDSFFENVWRGYRENQNVY